MYERFKTWNALHSIVIKATCSSVICTVDIKVCIQYYDWIYLSFVMHAYISPIVSQNIWFISIAIFISNLSIFLFQYGTAPSRPLWHKVTAWCAEGQIMAVKNECMQLRRHVNGEISTAKLKLNKCLRDSREMDQTNRDGKKDNKTW